MINRLLAVIVVGATLLAGGASAGDGQVVPLAWKAANPQRKGQTARVATIPHAQVVFTKEADGTRYLRVQYSDGITCSTAASRSETEQNISFSCGTRSTYYWIGQTPGEMPVVEWIGSPAIGERGN